MALSAIEGLSVEILEIDNRYKSLFPIEVKNYRRIYPEESTRTFSYIKTKL